MQFYQLGVGYVQTFSNAFLFSIASSHRAKKSKTGSIRGETQPPASLDVRLNQQAITLPLES